MDFVKAYNSATESQAGTIIPVEITIYDVAGREVRTLVGEKLQAGDGVAVWDGLDGRGEKVASGVYFARLNIDGLTASGKLMYLK